MRSLKQAVKCDETCKLVGLRYSLRGRWCWTHLLNCVQCEACGEWFHTYRLDAKTCGDKCRKALSRKSAPQSA